MESIWLLCNEKSTSADLNPYDATDDHEGSPAYDGRTSFFAFEDAIDDWCDITELEPEKRGPALRNRLEGDALQYKRLPVVPHKAVAEVSQIGSL